jgi:hypothetical protein
MKVGGKVVSGACTAFKDHIAQCRLGTGFYYLGIAMLMMGVVMIVLGTGW